MKTNKFKKVCTVITTALLMFATQATAGGWTNWFTIQELGYHSDGTGIASSNIGHFVIVPDGTVENLDSCGSASLYASQSMGSAAAQPTTQYYNQMAKLATLAYTAGWQVRVYLDGCETHPRFKSVEIQKP